LEGGDIPVTWTNTKYRMLYTNMGHGNRIFTSPQQNRFFESALLWLGRQSTIPGGGVPAR
jgi:type 1 glutamine amidotransferase